jgi:hypothetical protein
MSCSAVLTKSVYRSKPGKLLQKCSKWFKDVVHVFRRILSWFFFKGRVWIITTMSFVAISLRPIMIPTLNQFHTLTLLLSPPQFIILPGQTKGMVTRGRRCKQLLDELNEKTICWKLKTETLDGIMWRTYFGRGYGPVTRQAIWWIMNYEILLKHLYKDCVLN